MTTKVNNLNIPFEDLKLLNLEDDAFINQEHKARDLDGDGDSDLFLGFGSFPQQGDFPQYPAILENNGDGTFSVVEIKNQTSKFIGPMIAEFADFNKDGRLDIFLGASGRDADPFPGGQNFRPLQRLQSAHGDNQSAPQFRFPAGAPAPGGVRW